MTLIYFIFVLGITILVHEFGHFIFAKRAGIYVYEFSIGMGPRLFKWKRKNDETEYSIRLLPIGGYVSMAGEDSEDKKIPKDKQLCNKSWKDRFLTISAGVLFNFILAIILLFIVGLVAGVPKNDTVIKSIDETFPISETEIKPNDKIIKINNTKINSYEDLSLELALNEGKTIKVTVLSNKKEVEAKFKPLLVEIDGEKAYKYGFTLVNESEKGVLPAIGYAFTKTGRLVKQMAKIIKYLLLGKLKLNNLSGPVGIFKIVDSAAAAGFINIIYLIAYLCINVGFVNFIPIPAFDGGRLLFLIIEKIKGSRVNPKVENTIHFIGFIFLMLLMVVITYNDILRLFK